jgi:hypothetical protein
MSEALKVVGEEKAPELACSLVPIEGLFLIWKEITPFLEGVVEVSHGDLTINCIRNKLLRGDSQLLVVTDGTKILCATTVNVETYGSGKRVLLAPVIGGEGIEIWGDLLIETVRDIAKKRLCDEIRGLGREGWKRLWGKKGLKPIMTIYSLEV